MMATPEEARPLRASLDGNGPESGTDQRAEKTALGATAAYLLLVAVVCVPPVVRLWHPAVYTTHGLEEQRGWTWLGVNSLWLALALLWTLLHLDNGPCVATACLLCSLLWAYLFAVFVSQACRGQLPLWAIANGVVCAAMLMVCFRTAWVDVAKKTPKARADGSATWIRVLRKWTLVSASVVLLTAFVACWVGNIPLAPPVSGKEPAPWEWNSAVLFVMMLALLWAAFLTRGGLVDETKRAACAWIAMALSGSFVLCSFSWPALGLNEHSLVTSVLLAVEIAVLIVAAVI